MDLTIKIFYIIYYKSDRAHAIIKRSESNRELQIVCKYTFGM